MSLDEIVANIPSEGEELKDAKLDEEEKETPPSSPEEKKQAEEAPSQEGEKTPDEDEDKQPLHKQKRWQQIYSENKRMKDEIAEFKREQEEKFRAVEEKLPQSPQAIPEWAQKLVGDNQEAYSALLKGMTETSQRMLGEREKQNEIQSAQEKKAIADAKEYVDSSVATISDREGVDKNEFMKFLTDFKEKYNALPEDIEGNIDFEAGYKMFLEFNKDKEDSLKAKSKARKSIADFSTTSKQSTESQEKDYLSSADIAKAGGDWRNL